LILEGGNDPAVVGQYVTDWMNAYLVVQQENQPVPNADCQTLGGLAFIPGFETVELCEFISIYEFSWARFIETMLNGTASAFGISNFTSIKAGFDNRVPALKNTDLFLPATIAPSFRYQDGNGATRVSYLGPTDSDSVFTVPLSMQYAVKNASAGYIIGTEKNTQPLITRTAPAPSTFDYDDWTDYAIFQDYVDTSTGNLLIEIPDAVVAGEFQSPFNGEATAVQVAAVSSAFAAVLGGSSPSMMSQFYSTIAFGIGQTLLPDANKLALQDLVEANAALVYNFPGFEGSGDLGVCSQWPQPCGAQDANLMDGGYTDGLNLALNIGQYQTVDGGSLLPYIKVIVTLNNFETNNNKQFLQYFETAFNTGVEPGGFTWAPSITPGVPEATPWRSPQIFMEELQNDEFIESSIPILGTSLTSAVHYGTTVDNPAYGVKAGQQVQILLLQLNSDIPVFILTEEDILQHTEPLASLSELLAGNEELQNRIQEFMKIPRAPGLTPPSEGPDMPTVSPSQDSAAFVVGGAAIFSFFMAVTGVLLM
jgi:hypothetical protein